MNFMGSDSSPKQTSLDQYFREENPQETPRYFLYTHIRMSHITQQYATARKQLLSKSKPSPDIDKRILNGIYILHFNITYGKKIIKALVEKFTTEFQDYTFTQDYSSEEF